HENVCANRLAPVLVDPFGIAGDTDPYRVSKPLLYPPAIDIVLGIPRARNVLIADKQVLLLAPERPRADRPQPETGGSKWAAKDDDALDMIERIVFPMDEIFPIDHVPGRAVASFHDHSF